MKELKLVFGLKISNELEDEVFDTRVFPHLSYPVIFCPTNKPVIKPMNYSLIPRWSSSNKPKFATYNARIETIAEKPTWKEPLKSHRCIVPLDAFYESCYEGTHAGNIVAFKSKSGHSLSVAGLWEEWTNKDTGEVIPSFAVITTKPTESIKKVGHDRCPLFLNKNSVLDWIKPAKRNAEDCRQFLLENFQEPDLVVEIDRPLKPGWEKRK